MEVEPVRGRRARSLGGDRDEGRRRPCASSSPTGSSPSAAVPPSTRPRPCGRSMNIPRPPLRHLCTPFNFPTLRHEGALLRHSLHLRHRHRGDRLLRHHRLPEGHQIPAGRLQHHPGRGHRRSRAGRDHAPEADRPHRYGRHDPRHRGLCLHPALRLHRSAGPARHQDDSRRSDRSPTTATWTPATACTTPSAWPVWPSPTRCWASSTPWRTRPAPPYTGGHIVHGCANAMYLPKVIKYNAKNAEAAERYAEIADFIGLQGAAATDELVRRADRRAARAMNDSAEHPHLPSRTTARAA